MADTPPTTGGADTLAPASATRPEEKAVETFVVGGAPPSSDETIRPFRFRASDEDLAT